MNNRRHSAITAQQIKTLRRAMGVTQANLAHRLGITVNTVSHWERGKFGPAKYLTPVVQSLLDFYSPKKGV